MNNLQLVWCNTTDWLDLSLIFFGDSLFPYIYCLIRWKQYDFAVQSLNIFISNFIAFTDNLFLKMLWKCSDVSYYFPTVFCTDNNSNSRTSYVSGNAMLTFTSCFRCIHLCWIRGNKWFVYKNVRNGIPFLFVNDIPLLINLTMKIIFICKYKITRCLKSKNWLITFLFVFPFTYVLKCIIIKSFTSYCHFRY